MIVWKTRAPYFVKHLHLQTRRYEYELHQEENLLAYGTSNRRHELYFVNYVQWVHNTKQNMTNFNNLQIGIKASNTEYVCI